MRARMMATSAIACFTLGLGLTACASPPASGGNTTSTMSTPASPTGSPTAEAWVRGTKVTLTNATGTTQYLATGTGEYTALAPGAGTSLSAPSTGGSSTSVTWYWKLNDATAFAIQFANPTIGTPYFEAKGLVSPTDRQYDKVYGMLREEDLSEGETKTMTLINSHQQTLGTLTATRNADDDDNKNWTATLDTNTAG